MPDNAESGSPSGPAGDEGALGRLLLQRGLLTPESLNRVRLIRQETPERFDAVVTRLGLVSERAVAEALGEIAGVPSATSADYPAEAVVAVDAGFLRGLRAVPLRRDDAGIEAAFADPSDTEAVAALAFAIDGRVRAKAAPAGDVEAAIDRLYGAAAAPRDDGEGAADLVDLERLQDLASDAPVVRAVNALIARAAQARASDIHVEAAEDGLKVRLRIDGVLQPQPTMPAHFKAAFVSRVKVMAGLNIAERRLPQDGRMRLAVRGHEIDLRVATSPTLHGESVVMRLLDRSGLTLDFDALGFDPEARDRFRAVLNDPHGVLLVTGPTGSGKTTTLYAALAALNTPERKILTVEDPVEYRLQGVSQTQVNPTIGLDFAAALRSFLRQDPDVMMVGEIRDLETAQVAVQAALTGHLVLSTLHTNSAASAVTRLLDMGVEPFLITSTLNGVLAQRLVRRLCPRCSEPYAASPGLRAALHAAAEDADSQEGGEEAVELLLRRPRGCPACDGSGFRGRLAVTELLVMDGVVSRLVLERAEARQIDDAARRGGMRSLLQDGVAKVRAGLTTFEDVLRVTGER